jgi:hypothetical protein
MLFKDTAFFALAMILTGTLLSAALFALGMVITRIDRRKTGTDASGSEL